MSKPVPQKIQPIEFFGRREATNAPTVGKLSAITLKSTVKASAVCLLAIGGLGQVATPWSRRAPRTASR